VETGKKGRTEAKAASQWSTLETGPLAGQGTGKKYPKCGERHELMDYQLG